MLTGSLRLRISGFEYKNFGGACVVSVGWVREEIGKRHTRRVSHLTFWLFLLFAFRLLPIARLQLDHSDLPGKKSRVQKRMGSFYAFSATSPVCLLVKTIVS